MNQAYPADSDSAQVSSAGSLICSNPFKIENKIKYYFTELKTKFYCEHKYDNIYLMMRDFLFHRSTIH